MVTCCDETDKSSCANDASILARDLSWVSAVILLRSITSNVATVSHHRSSLWDFAVKLRGWILNQSRKSTSNPRMRNCYSHPDLCFIRISYYTRIHSITTHYVLVVFLKYVTFNIAVTVTTISYRVEQEDQSHENSD